MSYHSAALICDFERIDKAEQTCDILRSKLVLVPKVEVRFCKPPQLVDLLDAGGIAQRSRVSQHAFVQLTHQLSLGTLVSFLGFSFAATSFENEKSGDRIFCTTSASYGFLMFREFQCAICIIFF